MRIKLLSVLMLLSAFCFADTYKIIKLSNSPIIIGGVEKKVNSTFTDTETITWKYDKQGMWVQDMTQGGYRYFSKDAFQEANATTARGYIYFKTNHPSTRDVNFLQYKKVAYNSEKRIALVIGNSNYIHESSLRNPIADATEVVDKLRDLGFDVMVTYDADLSGMNKAVEDFKKKATGYATTVFYYAGHGQQYNGVPYLIPIDANIQTKDDVISRCVRGPRIVSFIDEIKAKTNIVIIDACRSNLRFLRDSGSEDLRMDAPDNGLIFFSTKSGQPALDGEGIHSPFADAFIKCLSQGNISLNDLVLQVTKSVKNNTSSYDSRQQPNSMGSMDHNFYFDYRSSSQSSTNATSTTTSTTTSTSTPSVVTTTTTHNGYEYVDLGLPSGLKWATCNVGASRPEDSGNYYAWGETQVKDYYKHTNYSMFDPYESLNYHLYVTKYYTKKTNQRRKTPGGIVDNKTTLEPVDDVASKTWGGAWRMPTKSEINELLKKCRWIWLEINGRVGYKVIGPNGRSIFLPASGMQSDKNYRFHEVGFYWSSSLYEEDSDTSYVLIFDKNVFNVENKVRDPGYSVRPVFK